MTSSVNPLSEKTQIWGSEAGMYLAFSSSLSNSILSNGKFLNLHSPISRMLLLFLHIRSISICLGFLVSSITEV